MRQPRVTLAAVFTVVLLQSMPALADELHDAAWDGDFAKVKALVESNPELVHARDDMSRTPLHRAARGSHADMVRYLLLKGAKVNATAYNSFTPLHLTSNGEVARILIAAGADLHAIGASQTPLQNAASSRKMDVVQALLNAGETIDLISAIDLGWTEHAKTLVESNPAAARSTDWPVPIARAASRGRKKIVVLLLEHGADVNAGIQPGNSPGRYTALVAAALSGHMDIGEYLLENGADPNVGGGKNDDSLLDWAIKHAEPRFATLLLECGADPNFTPDWPPSQATPLHRAAHSGRTAMVASLLSFGANVNAGTEVVTPVLLAAANGHTEAAMLLIEAGADLDVHSSAALGNSESVLAHLDSDPLLLESRDKYVGRTPLAWATKNGHLELATLLLARGADANARATRWSWSGDSAYFGPIQDDQQPSSDVGEAPLHLAAALGDPLLVKVLLDNGADVNARNKNHQGQATGTPLQVAAAGGHLEVARLLLLRGADVNIPGESGYTPLHAAVRHTEMVRLLVEHGADVNATTEHGGTPIQWARVADPEVGQILLAAGARFDIHTACRLGRVEDVRHMLGEDPSLANALRSDRPRQTVLATAAEHGHLDLVELLLESGADPNHREAFKQTPLYAAAKGGHVAAVRLLISRGAGVRGRGDRTPLHAAAMSDNGEIARLLIELGADIHASGRIGSEPIHTAALFNSVAVLGVLLDAGVDVDVRGRGDGGSTPLHSAASGGAREATELLLARGADAWRTNHRGETPLEIAERVRPPGFGDDEEKIAARRDVAMILRRHLESK